MEIEKKPIENNEVVSVNYTQPKFWHRCMANLVDFVLFVAMFILLFIAARAIVSATPDYKRVENRIADIQVNESGLYMYDPLNEGKIVDAVYYSDKYLSTYGSDFAGNDVTGRIGKVVHSINQFIDYCSNPDVVPAERYNELVSYYESIRLETVNKEGIHYFVKDGDNIIPNETLANDAEKRQYFYKDVYAKFVEKRCLPFLTANVTEYRELYRVEFNYLVFAELPSAYILAGILVYFVPPLFLRRGRMTLGKALYRIGLIDDRMLSPTFARFTARSAIFIFGELLLSLFTFGIPYIISFTLMAFSKHKQGFPDYMLHLYEIDTSKANIYMNYVEATLKNELHGEAVDFQMEKPL